MKLRFIFLLACVLGSCALNAQDTIPDDDIPTGKIKVKKPEIHPYVKVEFRYTLAHVRKTEVLVQVAPNLPLERDWAPVYDSAYSVRLKRMYPQKTLQLARYFSTNMLFTYTSSDTPRADTMYVGMWIDSKGKIRYVRPDTSWTGDMPVQLAVELYSIASSLRDMDWGKGGGYFTEKRFLHQPEFFGESYYCEMYVIVSSYPMTAEQKRSGSKFAPFDYPLNSPPVDEQQRQFMEENPK
jgi:hypothetical protein